MRTIDDINALMDYVENNPINFTWLNPNTETRQSTIPNSGNGRFAINDINKGDIIAILGGIVLTEDEYQKVRKRFPFVSGLLIHEDFKLHQLNMISENNGSLNHACDPNCGFDGQVILRTIKPIKAGQELFADYGTITDQDLVLFENCECGSPNCRKYITAKDWLSTSFQSFHRSNFSYNILKLIVESTPETIKKQLFDLKRIDINKSPILLEEYEKYTNM